MKKLFLVMMLALGLFLMACSEETEQDAFVQMDIYEIPQKIENVQMEEPKSITDFLTSYDLWVNRYDVLNETETIYYAPLSIHIGSEVYLNRDIEEPVYVICQVEGTSETCQIVGESIVNEIYP